MQKHWYPVISKKIKKDMKIKLNRQIIYQLNIIIEKILLH